MEQIDILMATYNGETYVKEQIESILQQTHTNFRLIISDDASTDNTKKILREFEQKDDRIKVYYQEENMGYVKNFEFLLKKVENELYALADQDDIWLPNKIEKSLANMKENDSDLVFCDLILIDEKGDKIADSFWKNKKLNKKIKKDKKCEGLRLNNYITGCTILSKKEFLPYILPIPKNSKYLIHDYWIAIVVSLKGKISYLKEPYVKYRQHESNQVGYKMKSKELKSLEKIRNLFIDVKIDHFTLLQEHPELFDEKQRKENGEALKYFKSLKEIKTINFKNWYLFYKMYHYETFTYFLANFIILNMPKIAKIIYRKG